MPPFYVPPSFNFRYRNMDLLSMTNTVTMNGLCVHNGNLYVAADGGKSLRVKSNYEIELVTTPQSDANSFLSIDDGRLVLVSGSAGGIYYSDDDGDNFTLCNIVGTSPSGSATAAAYDGNGTVCVYDGSATFVSGDFGESYTRVAAGGGAIPGLHQQQALCWSPSYNRWIQSGNGGYRMTTDPLEEPWPLISVTSGIVDSVQDMGGGIVLMGSRNFGEIWYFDNANFLNNGAAIVATSFYNALLISTSSYQYQSFFRHPITGDCYAGCTRGSLQFSENNGKNWKPINTVFAATNKLNQMAYFNDEIWGTGITGGLLKSLTQ